MIELLKNYIEKRIDLLRLDTTENVVKVMSVAIHTLLIIGLGICFFSFLFMGIGFMIGVWLGNYAYGFLIVSAFFLICFLLLLSQKKGVIEYIKEKFVQIIYNED